MALQPTLNIMFFKKSTSLNFEFIYPILRNPHMVQNILLFSSQSKSSIFQIALLNLLSVNDWIINPFHTTGPFLYPLKTSENHEVFWCFQGIKKETSGMKWVTIFFFFTIKLFALIFFIENTYPLLVYLEFKSSMKLE